MRKRVAAALALILSCVMALSAFPTKALAVVNLEEGDIEYQYDADGNKEKITAIHLDPYTLECWDEYVDGEELSISNLNNIAQQLSQTWAPIAGAIWEDNSMVTVNSEGDDIIWHEWYGPSVKNGAPDYGGRVDVVDALKGRSKKNSYDSHDDGADRYNFDGSWRSEHDDDDSYMTSGLQYATSLNDILLEMCDMSGKTYAGDEIDNHSNYTNARKDKAEELYKLAGKDDKGLGWMKADAGKSSTQAFYRIVSSDNWDSGDLYSNNYALIFYDFHLTALGVDEQVGPYKLEESPVDSVNSEFVENRSQKDAQETFTLTDTTTETITNTTQESETITHGINAGIEVDMQFGSPSIHKFNVIVKTHFNYSWSKAVQTMHSEAHAITNTATNTSTTSVTVPPHTAIAIDKTVGETTKTLKYRCPTVLNYKVAIVSLCWQPEDEEDEKIFSARFGCGSDEGGRHATQNLYMRAVNETTKNRLERPFGQTLGTYSEDDISVSGVNWSSVETKFPNLDVSGCIQTAATKLPLFTSNMVMTAQTTSNSSSLGRILPLYPLSEVKLSGADKRYTMTAGESMSLAGLKVEGYDEYDVAYFGFAPNKGEWVLCDEDGNELGSSNVVELNYDKGTKTQEVVAKNDGEAYLKWVIADGVIYETKDGEKVTRDTEPLITPIIRVTVNKVPTDLTGYHIEAEGEPTVVVGKNLDLNNAFDASVIDASDSVLTHSVTFEARDKSDASPVSIDDSGTFVSTKAGDHKVRATYTLPNAIDGVVIKSDWLIVHAIEPKISVEPEELGAEGGTADIAISATRLTDGIEVVLTDEDGNEIKGTTTGSDAKQSVSIELPANTVFNADKVYNVSYVFGDSTIATDKTVTVKANTLKAVAAIDATCTKAGNIAYWECNETGKLYADETGTTEISLEDTAIDALGHDLVKTDEVPATCTEDGNIEHWECSRCRLVFSDEAGKNEVAKGDVTTYATGHDWDEGVVTTEPTCEKPGVKTYTCQNDESHTKTEEVSALGHAWDDGVITTEPMCETEGVRTYTCERDSNHTYTVTINATGHTWGEWLESIPPTEDTPGQEKRICIYCSIEQTRTIPAYSHVHDLVEVLETEATCTTEGNIAYYKCSTCGRLFADYEATQSLDEEDVVIGALGHDWDDGSVTEEPSCIKTGTKTYTCKREGCSATKTEELPALGHAYDEGAVTTEPTCEAEGVKTFTCANDADHTYTERIAALGHEWDEGKVTTEPTCEKAGVRTYTCTHDGSHTYTEEIAAIGHAWDEGTVTTKPSCTKKGVRTFHCTHQGCEKTKTEDIKAIGHSWGAGKVTKKPTCTQAGVKTFTCTNDSSHTKTESIAATGHKWGAWKKLNATQHQRVCSNDKSHTQKANHTWDSGKVTKAATYTTEGVRTYTCKVCHGTKTAKIAKKKGGLLLDRMTCKGNNALVITWNSIYGADGYDVFFAACGTPMQYYKTVRKGETLSATRYSLKVGKCYKAQVRAFVWSGSKKIYISNGNSVHCFTNGGNKTYTNPKSVKVNKTTFTVKAGKTVTVKASVTKVNNSKELVSEVHATKLRYVSSNNAVATVDYAGRIKGVSKGTCKVYIYAANGQRVTVSVTVTK